MPNEKLKYAPFQSVFTTNFWHRLINLKLDSFRLFEGPISMASQYSIGSYNETPLVTLDSDSFCQLSPPQSGPANTQKQLQQHQSYSLSPNCFPVGGRIWIFNTVEAFTKLDKAGFLNKFGAEFLVSPAFSSSAVAEEFDLNSLCQLFVICFGDLKRYNFHYWTAYPAVFIEAGGGVGEGGGNLSMERVGDVQSLQELLITSKAGGEEDGLTPMQRFQTGYDEFQQMQRKSSSQHHPQIFFKVVAQTLQFERLDLKRELEKIVSNTNDDATGADGADRNDDWLIGFCDPSTFAEHPGWPLRNLLAVISINIKKARNFRVICFRDRYRGGLRSSEHSFVLTVRVPPANVDLNVAGNISLQFVGWEKNSAGQLKPRKVSLADSMDPKIISESAVNLNLKLMKWRIMPELRLEPNFGMRALLFGAGTLGCAIARQLIGWGIKHVTFVDSGYVSYSNPVRQSLYTYRDCANSATLSSLNTSSSTADKSNSNSKSDSNNDSNSASKRKGKAEIAALALQQIYPGVVSSGHHLAVPMPGHSVPRSNTTALESCRQVCDALHELVRQHDVIFILLDTREGRWLPTLLAKLENKLCINAALGFDSYLVMRHGMRVSPHSKVSAGTADSSGIGKSLGQSNSAEFGASTIAIPGDQLGCYFCNDVVAPANSTLDRTLDQQCTVTRPGASMIASAYAVELLMSLTQHPKGAFAPAFVTINSKSGGGDRHEDDSALDKEASPLGNTPHQIRGHLSSFSSYFPTTQAFDQCTACSSCVLDAFEKDGFEFLLKVFNDFKFLEELTGLNKLQNLSLYDNVTVLSDDDEDQN